MSYLVYLSGPICGLTFQETTQWRRELADAFKDYDLDILDPMRDVTAENPMTDVIDETSSTIESVDSSMMSDRGIVTRDFNDTCRADIIIVNLLGAKRASIGTVSELAWAFDRKIPTVVVMERSGNIHDHPFVREFASYRVDTIERAVDVTVSVLGCDLW